MSWRQDLAERQSYRPLTDRQREILGFIVETVAESGAPPSIREIGYRFLMSSTNGVSDVLIALRRKGYLETVGKRARGTVLTEAARREILGPPCLACGGKGRRR
jgi:SOS-response transcriptional repressor LexA